MALGLHSLRADSDMQHLCLSPVSLIVMTNDGMRRWYCVTDQRNIRSGAMSGGYDMSVARMITYATDLERIVAALRGLIALLTSSRPKDEPNRRAEC